MNLFELKNYEIQIQPEAYAIGVFKDIWDRDDSLDKSVAIGELAYVYFMSDYKSDFAQILNEEDRKQEIIRNIPTLPKGWYPDAITHEAIKFYRDRQSTISLLLLNDVYSAVDKLRAFYREVDLLLTDDHGKPIHDVAKLTRAIESTGKIVESLNTLEEKVKRDTASSAMRGGRKKAMFEDDDD